MSSSKKTRSGRVIKKPLVYSPRMKLDGEMPDMAADEKVLYDELNKVSDSPVRKDVWEKVNELEKFDKRVKYTKDDFDEEDEESSFGEEEHTETVDVVVPTTTEAKRPMAPSKKRKREEDDEEDEDYIEEEFDEEESDEESDEGENESDIKIELEEQKLDELAKSGELVNPDEADIFEDAIPLDKLGEGPPEEEEESILDS